MTDKPGFRDAIHVPFLVVTCDVDVPRAAKAWIISDDRRPNKCCLWRASTEDDPQPDWHGVADPWCDGDVIAAGTPFRLMLRKECFRELRHDFTIEVHDRGGTATCHSVCDVY